MKDLILIGYEFITVVFPALLTMGIFCLLYRKKSIRVNHRHFIYLAVFAVYMFGVFHFTGAGTIFDARLYGLEFNASQLNLIPFSNRNIDIMAYGLNVLLFVPLGFLLPFIWPHFRKIKYACVYGFSLSLLVELSQLLNNRRTDVDDLIVNTVGAILGFALFQLYSRVTKRDSVPMEYHRYEAIILVSVMFLCRFFFYNEFGMAKVLYGF